MKKKQEIVCYFFPGKLIVQTIVLRSYFALAEANTYINISNGFLALINLWLITNKEFHLPAKAAKQLFRNNYRRVEFSNLRAAEKQPIWCLYTRPRKKGKKNWRVKSWLRRTLPPSPLLFPFLREATTKRIHKSYFSLKAWSKRNSFLSDRPPRSVRVWKMKNKRFSIRF